MKFSHETILVSLVILYGKSIFVCYFQYHIYFYSFYRLKKKPRIAPPFLQINRWMMMIPHQTKVKLNTPRCTVRSAPKNTSAKTWRNIWTKNTSIKYLSSVWNVVMFVPGVYRSSCSTNPSNTLTRHLTKLWENQYYIRGLILISFLPVIKSSGNISWEIKDYSVCFVNFQSILGIKTHLKCIIATFISTKC